jgi:type I restriction enzyme S subunit
VINRTFSIYQGLPSSFNLVPLSSISIEVKKRNSDLRERNLLSLSYGRIIRKDIDGDGGLLPESFDGYNIIQDNDIVLRLTDLQNDKRSLRTGIAKEEGIITSAYTTLRPVGVDPRWLAYTLHSYDIQKVFYSLGSGLRQSMNYSNLKELSIHLPPIEEQRRIADYLEQETSKVTDIIGKKEELLIVLADEFTSLVDEQMLSVTEKIKLKYRFRISNGNSISAEYIELNRLDEVAGLPFIATKELGFDGKINYETDLHIPMHLEENFRIANPGVVFICAEGGSAGKKFGINHERACFGNKLFAISSKAKLSEEFLYFVFWSTEFQSQFRVSMNGMIGGVSSGSLGEIRIPLCDGESQFAITNLLSKKYANLRSAINQIELSTLLLNEYVRSLTTACVTGQLNFPKGRFLA